MTDSLHDSGVGAGAAYSGRLRDDEAASRDRDPVSHVRDGRVSGLHRGAPGALAAADRHGTPVGRLYARLDSTGAMRTYENRQKSLLAGPPLGYSGALSKEDWKC